MGTRGSGEIADFQRTIAMRDLRANNGSKRGKNMRKGLYLRAKWILIERIFGANDCSFSALRYVYIAKIAH